MSAITLSTVTTGSGGRFRGRSGVVCPVGLVVGGIASLRAVTDGMLGEIFLGCQAFGRGNPPRACVSGGPGPRTSCGSAHLPRPSPFRGLGRCGWPRGSEAVDRECLDGIPRRG